MKERKAGVVPARGGVDISAHLVQSLDHRWEKFLKELGKCQRTFSEKTVHDLRVATRRLISTLDILRHVMPENLLRMPRRQLRKNLKAFSPLRDTQVQLLAVESMVGDYPELKPFLTMLKVREQRQVRRLSIFIKSIKSVSLQQSVDEVRTYLQTVLSKPVMQDPLKAAVVGAAAAAFARVVDLHARIGDGDPASIHKLRVAFKKFRYTAEAAQPFLIGVTGDVLKAINDYQQRMGNIQDVEVLRANLSAFVLRWRKTSGVSMRRVFQELARRRKASTELFLGTSDELFLFWKPSVSVVVHGNVHQ